MIITELRARKQTSMRTDVLFPLPPPFINFHLILYYTQMLYTLL